MVACSSAFYVAPFCPAGHLPHKGGDQPAYMSRPIYGVANDLPAKAAGSISPLVGEMSGRTEGGAKERQPFRCQTRRASP
jgi:hypothetical protein